MRNVFIETAGIVRKTNPVAKVNGAKTEAMYDDKGRAIMVPFQVRDLISTGSANLTRVAETTIIAAVAATLLDLVYVAGSNTSNVAIRVDLRYGTGGAVIDSMVIPAASITEKQYKVPFPMSEVAQPITAQVNQSGEISDSPVIVTAIAAQNI